MRYVIAVMLACLLAACTSPATIKGPSCTTTYECEVVGYLKYAS